MKVYYARPEADPKERFKVYKGESKICIGQIHSFIHVYNGEPVM